MGIASPVIANLALDGLEKLLKAHDSPHTKRTQRATVHLGRSADACIMTISAYALALELALTSAGMLVALPRPHGRICSSMHAKQRADVWHDLAAHVNLRRAKQPPRGPMKKPTQRTADSQGGHVSTAPVLAKQI